MIIRGRVLFSDNFVESRSNYLQSESGTLKLQDWKLILLSFKFQNNLLIQLFHNDLDAPYHPNQLQAEQAAKRKLTQMRGEQRL